MSVEIQEAGYQSVRDFVEANWIWFELRDDNGEAIFRVDITDDERFQWTHIPGAPMLVLEGLISGSELSLPETVEGAALFDSETSEDILAEDTATEFVFEDTADLLQIFFRIEIPEVI